MKMINYGVKCPIYDRESRGWRIKILISVKKILI